MIYSVWNPDGRRYDYFQDGAPASDSPQPNHLHSRGGDEVGIASTRAAWPLPAGTKPAGSGPEPRGMLASLGGWRDGGGSWLPALGLGVAAWGLWKIFGKNKGQTT